MNEINKELQRAGIEVAARLVAIQQVIVRAGLTTMEELDVLQARAITVLDQMIKGADDGR